MLISPQLSPEPYSTSHRARQNGTVLSSRSLEFQSTPMKFLRTMNSSSKLSKVCSKIFFSFHHVTRCVSRDQHSSCTVNSCLYSQCCFRCSAINWLSSQRKMWHSTMAGSLPLLWAYDWWLVDEVHNLRNSLRQSRQEHQTLDSSAGAALNRDILQGMYFST